MPVPLQRVSAESDSHRLGGAAAPDANRRAANLSLASGLSPWVMAVCSEATRSGLTQPRCSLLEGLIAGGLLQMPGRPERPADGNTGQRTQLRMKGRTKDWGR